MLLHEAASCFSCKPSSALALAQMRVALSGRGGWLLGYISVCDALCCAAPCPAVLYCAVMCRFSCWLTHPSLCMCSSWLALCVHPHVVRVAQCVLLQTADESSNRCLPSLGSSICNPLLSSAHDRISQLTAPQSLWTIIGGSRSRGPILS